MSKKLLYTVFVIIYVFSGTSLGAATGSVFGTGVGVGASIDVQPIKPVINNDGDFVYQAKLLCGTIFHLTSDPQVPGTPGFPQIPLINSRGLVPATYLTDINITNPHSIQVNGQTTPSRTPGRGGVGELALPPFFKFPISCLDFYQEFDPAQPFEEINLTIISTHELLVTGVYSQKNVIVSQEDNILSGFYHCRKGRTDGTWADVATLNLTNPGKFNVEASILIFDGKSQLLAKTLVNLSPSDFDEINICRTLFSGGLTVPPAGFIYIIPRNGGGQQPPPPLPPPPFIVVWIIDYIGKFFFIQDDPFAGRVTCVGKTIAVQLPGNVIDPDQIQNFLNNAKAISPVLISNTIDL